MQVFLTCSECLSSAVDYIIVIIYICCPASIKSELLYFSYNWFGQVLMLEGEMKLTHLAISPRHPAVRERERMTYAIVLIAGYQNLQ